MRLHLRNPLTRTGGGCRHQYDDYNVDGFYEDEDDDDLHEDMRIW